MFLGFEALSFSGISEGPENRLAFGGEATMVIDWEVLIYAASHELITRPLDIPPSTAFSGTLKKAFRFDRSVIGSDRIGEEITIGFGELALTNLEKNYDFLAIDHTPLGQRIVIRYGDRRRPYSEWRTVLDGFMVDLQPDRDQVTFRLRDAGFKLDVPASPNVYLGTGGTEGGDDLVNKRKPRWFGWNLEVSPPLVIPASLAYQLNDGPVDSVQKVRVRGVEMVFSTDYATVALMNAAAITVGHYHTCLAAGWMRIGVAGGAELGQVTCDFCGDKAGGTFVATSADIVRRLLGATDFVDPDDLATATFDALNAAQPAPIGYGIPVGDEQTVATAVARIMKGIGGWGGSRRSGKFEVRRFVAPSGISSGTYNRTNLADLKLATLPSAISPPPWRVRVGWGRIWTPDQTNLAGSVSDTYRAFLAQQVRFASADDDNVRNDFPPGHELVEDQTYFRDEADALAEATRKLALFGDSHALYVLPLMEKLYVHELGNVITLQWSSPSGDRFGLENGVLGTIVKLTEDDAEGVEMTVFV